MIKDEIGVTPIRVTDYFDRCRIVYFEEMG